MKKKSPKKIKMGTVPTEWKDGDNGGKESEDGRGGCVVGGGGVGGRKQGQQSVRESEEGSEGECDRECLGGQYDGLIWVRE